MKTPACDVLIYGDQCGNDLVFGEFLARSGLRVLIARRQSLPHDYSKAVPPGFLQALRENDVTFVRSAWDLVRLARRARAVLTFTGAFGFTLNWRWPLRRLLGLPPVINYPTGSDFSELLADRGKLGTFYRYFVRTCALNAGLPYPHILENVRRFRVGNIAFVRHAYLLPPRDACRLAPPAGPRLRYFHPSHLDFRVNDAGQHRNSSKGNDRFLRAFVRALEAGLDAECILLERGPDTQAAKTLTRGTRFADRFIWRPAMSREDLYREMLAADVVVDQFDVGGLGGIAIEAMALGKPVMMYLQPRCLNIVYAEPPPVLNAHTEDEIRDRIFEYADRAQLSQVGVRARQWAYANHWGETCLEPLIFYYSLLTGHRVVDYCSVPNLSGTAAERRHVEVARPMVAKQ